MKILEDKGRIKDEWTLSKEEVEIAMKGELDNIRAWGTYLSTIKYNCDVIMGATFKVEDNEKIMAEDAGDAPEQVDVDILFPEYLVNIGACAA